MKLVEFAVEFLNRRMVVLAAIFDLKLTPLSDSVRASATELLDPKSVGVAFAISLLSCI